MQGMSLKSILGISASLGLALTAMPEVSFAQADLRSSFPGRRVGGGTRGECSARILAHIVPETSVYAPSATGDLAMVAGPTANPVPLDTTFKPKDGGPSVSKRFDASPAGLTLLKTKAITGPTLWESGFDCASADASGASADPLSFVESASPPAISMLVPEAEAADKSIQNTLKALRKNCGGSVPTQATMESFGLGDVVTPEWPQQLPVNCPS